MERITNITHVAKRKEAIQVRRIYNGYGIDKPLKMERVEPADEESKRVIDLGKTRTCEMPLSTEKIATVDDALKNCYMFTQLHTVESGNVACLSTGHPWDRQSSMIKLVNDIAQGVGGKNAEVVHFGPHKTAVIIRDGLSLEELLERFIEVPIDAYKHVPHLQPAVREIQARRRAEIFNPKKGNGKAFIETVNGKRKKLTRAYKEGKDVDMYSFQWEYEIRQGRLVGINLKGEEQYADELAIDPETKLMMEFIQNILTQNKGKRISILEIDHSATVSCCNDSFNAVLANDSDYWEPEAQNIFEKISLGTINNFPGGEKIVRFPNGETYYASDFCEECRGNTKKGKCRCNKEENQVQTAKAA